jgi:hypothetical protein
MQLIFGQDAPVAAWAGDRLGLTFTPPFVALGILSDDGELKGAAVFNQWNGWQIELSFYGPGCLTRPIIRALFWSYPFEQCGAGRLTASTRRSNKVTRGLLPRLGFTQEACLKRMYGPKRADDAFVFCMMRAQAERWK